MIRGSWWADTGLQYILLFRTVVLCLITLGCGNIFNMLLTVVMNYSALIPASEVLYCHFISIMRVITYYQYYKSDYILSVLSEWLHIISIMRVITYYQNYESNYILSVLWEWLHIISIMRVITKPVLCLISKETK